MNRRIFALWTLGVGLVIGFIGNALFYNHWIGLSFPFFLMLLIIVVLASGLLRGQAIRARNLWPLAAVLFFAVMVAVRGNPSLILLNGGAALSLGALTLYYLPLDRWLDEDPSTEHVINAVISSFSVAEAPVNELIDARDWLRDRRLRELTPLVAVGRGLLIALPVLLVFGLLLASADAVFGDMLEQIGQLLSPGDLGQIIGRLGLTLFLGWLACGSIAYGVARRETVLPPGRAAPEPEISAEALNELIETGLLTEEALTPAKKPFRLGMIESAVILGSVNLLFAAFVAVQVAYFFGGQANISLEGFTYADYARRGFFELLAVSVLTMGLIRWLDGVTVREGRRRNVLFISLSVAMIGLTVIMLISASQRMYLYEEAYGFTHLRVLTHIAMFWLGMLFVFVILSLLRLRANVFSLGLLLVAIGYLGTLDLMNVDYYIAERNVDRYANGQQLDIGYLSTLSVDAVPVLQDLYLSETLFDSPAARETDRDCIGRWLTFQLQQVEGAHANADLFSSNAAQEAAWPLLDAIRADLPPQSSLCYDRVIYDGRY